MNIFVLDEDPAIAALMLCDKHVVKMSLETAQLLCSVFWLNSLEVENIVIPYKITHYNHPCAVWARESSENFSWLLKHGFALCAEYSYRYDKTHKSESVINWCNTNKYLLKFLLNKQTSFVQAMPEEYRSHDPIISYRRYYLKEKRYFAKWARGRKSPEWFTEILS